MSRAPSAPSNQKHIPDVALWAFVTHFLHPADLIQMVAGLAAEPNRVRWPVVCNREERHDPAIHSSPNGRYLDAANSVSHLVRNRGARGRRHGRTRAHPEGGGEDDLGSGR